MASQKVHLRRCAASFVVATYLQVRLTPQDLRALHLELFTLPYPLKPFYDIIRLDYSFSPAKAERDVGYETSLDWQPLLRVFYYSNYLKHVKLFFRLGGFCWLNPGHLHSA